MNKKKVKRTENGFTLLEMLIVVAILAILFLLTVPNIQKTLGIIDKKGCDALIKTVDAAILQYRLDTNQTPSDTGSLIAAGLLREEQIRCDDGRTIAIQNGQAYAH